MTERPSIPVPHPYISVVVPARDEAGTIVQVVERSFAAYTELGCTGEVLVVTTAPLTEPDPCSTNCNGAFRLCASSLTAAARG